MQYSICDVRVFLLFLAVVQKCFTYVQATGKVLVGLSSPAITALSGTVSRSKHMGYMRINIAHVAVKWFGHVFPSF